MVGLQSLQSLQSLHRVACTAELTRVRFETGKVIPEKVGEIPENVRITST